MDITSSTLRGCVTSLETSTQLLNNSLSQLDTLMPDFRRLPQVLNQNKIFTIIPEFELTQAKGTIQNEISPKIEKLVKLIRGRIGKLERKIEGTKMKIQLNSVRIRNLERDEADKQRRLQEDENQGVEGTEAQLEILKRLKLKKERLRYKLSNLELENRKKRLSMHTYK
jgi:DASH complex subunit SPC19